MLYVEQARDDFPDARSADWAFNPDNDGHWALGDYIVRPQPVDVIEVSEEQSARLSQVRKAAVLKTLGKVTLSAMESVGLICNQ